VLVLLCAAAPAAAQWHVGVYLGTNHTQPAVVHILQPAASVDATYATVVFDAKPLQSPQYYGWRLERGVAKRGRLGVELEFTHLKVIAETDREYLLTGRAGASSVPGAASRMDGFVQRYAMSHGLNFILVNLVSRTPVGPADGPITLVVRGGAGPTLPHAETSVGNQERQQYEWGGVGLHGAAGIDLRLNGRWSLLAEYKLTYAKPTISIAGGTGQTTAMTHHLAVGIAIAVGSRH
jgi:hypothetical protein